MANYFPRQTVAWKQIEEPAAFRKLTLSLVEAAVLTGVVIRLLRSVALRHEPGSSWLYLGALIALGAVILFGMATAHLGNYPIRHWVWRAPLFGAVESAAEMLTSLPLIALGREPIGTARATLEDWPRMGLETLVYRTVAVCVFALVLAGVVQFVRWLLLKHEHREHTAIAIPDDIERHTAEHQAR